MLADEFDQLMADAKKQNETCAMRKCKVRVKILNLHCDFCNTYFCIPHHLPEVTNIVNIMKIYTLRTSMARII